MNLASINHQVLGALAFAGDLSMGQPPEHSPTVACLAERIAEVSGANDRVKTCAVQLALIRWAGCTANAREFSELLGDDVRGRAEMIAGRNPFIDTEPPTGSLHMAIAPLALAHCEATAMLAERIGLLPEVATSALDLFETWNGKGLPARKSEEDIHEAAQYVALAGDAEVFSRTFGIPHAAALIVSRAGQNYEPRLASETSQLLPKWIEELTAKNVLSSCVAGLPDRFERDLTLREAALVIGDFSDLKIPGHEGFSRASVDLIERTCPVLGLGSEKECLAIAAAVAGVGRVSVSNKKLGISTGTVSEEALLVPHWTGRILSRVPAIGSAADLAEQAYERLDGSGVGHGLLAPALSANARLVQAVRAVVEASDCYSKGQFNVENARAALQREVEQGRLDGRIVDAVLVGLGSKRLLGLSNQPDTSLTVREIDVLQQLATGATNKQIARSLSVSPKTVSTHLERVYSKLGVRTRAAATLKALETGLI